MKAVFRTGRAGANAAAPVGVKFEPAESLLDRAFKNVQRLRAETAHDPGVIAATAALRIEAAATDSTTCPSCDNEDAGEIYQCQLCHEAVCSECADTSQAPDYVVCNNCVSKEKEGKQQAAPAGPRPPAPSAVVPMAEARASTTAAAPVIPAAAASIARPPAAPVQDRAFFVQLERAGGLSNMDLWQVGKALHAIDRGETPEPWLGQKARDQQCAALHERLKNETSNDEKWRIIGHLEKLERGETPGEFIPAAVIKERLAIANAALAAETDPAEIYRLASQIDAVAQGAPFVSKQEAAAKKSALVARLEASTSNSERWNLAKEIAAL